MFLFRQEVHAFLVDLGVERRFILESRQQFFHGPWIKQRSRKAVLSGLASFLEHVDIFFRELCLRTPRIVSVDQLGQSKSARHASGAAADNHDIGWHLGVFDVRKGLTEDQHLALSL